MSASRSGWRDYAELGRISNLPTCVSNVLVGCAAAAGPARLDVIVVLGAAAAVALLYVAGMALNDVVDFEHDRRQRSQRPLPSGRVSRRSAVVFVALCLVGALAILAAFGAPAFLTGLALVATIVAYDITHKLHPAAVVLMGMCRGLVYAVAAACVAWPYDLARVGWLALGLMLYTIGLTIVARSETAGQVDARRWIAVALPIVVLLAAAMVQPRDWRPVAVAGAAMALWLARAVRFVFRRPPQTIKAVLTWISGMSLVDAYFLTLLGSPWLALGAAAMAGVSTWGHRRILGT